MTPGGWRQNCNGAASPPVQRNMTQMAGPAAPSATRARCPGNPALSKPVPRWSPGNTDCGPVGDCEGAVLER